MGAQTGAGIEICTHLAEEQHKFDQSFFFFCNLLFNLSLFRLALACETELKSNSLQESLVEKGAAVHLFKFKIGVEEDIKNLVEEVIEKYGGLDALVLALEEPFHGDLDGQDPSLVINSTLDANYFTHVYFTYYALPHLRKSRGRVVLLSSFKEEGQELADALFYASRGATLGT